MNPAPAGLSRRRAIRLLAAVAGLPLAAALAGASTAVGRRGLVHRWRGIALGAPAEIALADPEEARARSLIAAAVSEIGRLEAIFSLYRPDSELARLNRAGRIEAPSHDLLRLLSLARLWGERTGGAFDVTVQPLWRLYAGHFARHPDDEAGPPPGRIERARALVDFRAIEVAPGTAALARRGAEVTLNGIAQGYITDRVAELLRAGGAGNVLVDLGEFRALGRHPAGRPWTIGLADAAGRVGLENAALATSSGRGTRFDRLGRHHHLFDPATGLSAGGWDSVSVIAPDAATADALSTALAVLPPGPARALLAGLGDGVRARLRGTDGSLLDRRFLT